MGNTSTKYKTKGSIYTEYQRNILIDSKNKKIGLDCNRMFGDDMEAIKQQTKKLNNASSQQQWFIKKKIASLKEQLFDNFMATVRKISYLFRKDLIFAVFDGQKHWVPEITSVRDNKKTTTKSIQNHNFFWKEHNSIKPTLMFLLRKLGITVIEALYEADFQLYKMYYEKQIDYVYSQDLGYVDFGVPLIMSIENSGNTRVIDFTTIDPETIQNTVLREWVIQTRKINTSLEESTPLMKRIWFGLLCGGKHLKHPVLQKLTALQKMQLLLKWEQQKEYFWDFVAQLPFDIPALTSQEKESFNDAKIYYHLATVYSYQKQELEPLIPALSHFLQEGSYSERYLKRRIVGLMKQYEPYKILNQRKCIKRIGGKHISQITKMSPKVYEDWIFNLNKWGFK